MVLPRSKADIICFQEMKCTGDDVVRDAKRRARTLGWNLSMGEAKRLPSGHASGGCAVASRRGIGIAGPKQEVVAEGFHFRIHRAWVNGVVRGGVHVFSVYAKDSIGPRGENLEMLHPQGGGGMRQRPLDHVRRLEHDA